MIAPPPANPTRLAFLGTPDLSVAFLRALIEDGYEITLVVTGEDRRRGRREGPTPSPVKTVAEEHGLSVVHQLGALRDCGAQLGIVVAFGSLVPPGILQDLPMVNVHFSLLPRWRGPAPVEWAILAGDAKSGVCLMAVEGDFDVGAIYSHTEIPVGPRETVVQLKERLVGEGVKLLKATLSEGLKTPIPQIGQPTWAQKITVADRELDWTRPAVALDRLVRIGGAWTLIRGRRLKVLLAEPTIDVVEGPLGLLVKDQVITGEGALRLIEVQAQDRSRQTFDAWRAGARLQSETRLGE